MALDSLWYYSREDEKRGPVTSSEIHRLAHKKKIRPEDLVWCHGMDKWVPARTIRGMFPEDDDAGLLTDMFEAPQTQIEDPEESEAGGPPSLDQVNRYDEREPDQQQMEPLPEAFQMIHKWVEKRGRMMMVAGLMCFLLCQGCESIGNHQVQRSVASFDLIQFMFNDRYDKQIASLEADVLRYQTMSSLTPADVESMRTKNNNLTNLKNERAIEMAENEAGDWSRYRKNIQTQKTNFAIWSYYRQGFLLLVMLAIAVGCVGRFFSGRSTKHEKWLTLGLLIALLLPSITSAFV